MTCGIGHCNSWVVTNIISSHCSSATVVVPTSMVTTAVQWSPSNVSSHHNSPAVTATTAAIDIILSVYQQQSSHPSRHGARGEAARSAGHSAQEAEGTVVNLTYQRTTVGCGHSHITSVPTLSLCNMDNIY